MKSLKEDIPNITPGSSAKKELVLPEIVNLNMITPLGQTTKSFNVAPTSVTSKPQLSLNSTGGAGFNSNYNYLIKGVGATTPG